MANFFETPSWESGIYKIATTDPVQGGDVTIEEGNVVTGFSNVQAQQLTNRTAWLKQQVENLDTQQNVQSDGLVEDRALLVYDETDEIFKGSLKRQPTLDSSVAGEVLEVGSFGIGSKSPIGVDFITYEGDLPSGVYHHTGSVYYGDTGAILEQGDPVLVATSHEGSIKNSFAIFRAVGGSLSYMSNVNEIDYIPPVELLDAQGCDAVKADEFTANSRLTHGSQVHGSVTGNFTLNISKAYHIVNLVGAADITLNIGSVLTITTTSYQPLPDPVVEFTIILRNQTITSSNTVTFTNSNIRWEGGSFTHVGTSLNAFTVITGQYSSTLGLYFLSAKNYS